jgi:iron complex outermembrane receptor protein
MNKYFRLNKAPLAFAVLAGLSCSAFADETMKTMVVSATRYEVPEVVTPNSIVVIDRKKLDAMAAGNLTDVLRSQAGIQIADLIGDGSRASIDMRGFGATASNNTLIMVDGRKLNNATQQAPALNAIPLQDVERIEIIEGSGGTLYGDQAVGGVINIITRKATKDLHAYVESSVGSDDLQSVYGSASQLFDNGFAFRVSGKSRTADNFRDNNASDYGDGLVHLEQNADWGQVFLELQHTHDGLRLPGALTDTDLNTGRRQTKKPIDFSNYSADMFRLGTEVNLTDEWAILAELTDSDSDGKGHIFGDYYTQNTHMRTLSPRVKGAIPSAYGTTYITAGIDTQESDYQESGSFGSDYIQDSDAFYGQIVYPFYTNWSATVGMRDATVYDKNLKKNLKRDDNENISEFGVSWKPLNDLRLFARQAGVLRFANANDHGSVLPGTNFLNTQTGVSNELGAEVKTKAWDTSAVLFKMDLDDEIYYDSSADGGNGANINLPSSERTGLTLKGEYRFTDAVAVGANATYIDAELVAGSFKGKDMPFVANHTGTAYVNWAFAPNWSLYTDAVYTGSRYRGSDSANSQGSLSAYCLYNMAVRWDYKNFNTSLRLNNIGGEEYSGFTGYSSFSGNYQYPAPEETFELTVGYKF